MISATALSASTVPLNKSPQMPLGLENSRVRVDSQKFLVPSLPVSSRQMNPRQDHSAHHPHQHQQQHNHNHNHNHHHQPQHVNLHQHLYAGSQSQSQEKRRERSILNGTAASHSIPTPSALNGMRSTSPKGQSGSYQQHMQSSPRKDAHSPMYPGEGGFQGSYQTRNSVPPPCSSPSPGASASPKGTGNISLSPNGTAGGGGGSTFPPHFPPGLSGATNGASELSQLAVAAAAAAAASGGRLYPPGFPPPSAAHHAAFYAAAAAAAGHSLPYPGLFGNHFPPPHQNPAAAASSYLDFHTKLLRNSGAELGSPSQSPPNRSYHQQQSPPNILPALGSPQSTSVTSLHTKLIESVSAAGDRFHPHHNHIQSSQQQQQQHGHHHSRNFGQQGSAGVSKGGPLGISGGIMGLSISPNSNSPHKSNSELSSKSATLKLYKEHPGLPGINNGTSQQERKLLAEMEMMNGGKAKAELLSKQRMLNRSPEDFSNSRHQIAHEPHKLGKQISFAGDHHNHNPRSHPYMNGHASHQHHSYHTQQQQHHSNLPTPTNLSTDCKRANSGGGGGAVPSASHHMFLPPSPKKRSAHWNFAVPQSPHQGKIGDLLPPPPPPSDVDTSPILHLSPKYLSQTAQQNQKPSNGGPGICNIYQSPSSNAQNLLVVPSSPHSNSSSSSSHGGSGPSTPKSPSVHFKFFGAATTSAMNKENGGVPPTSMGRSGRVLNNRNDSSSSTSSIELGVINGNRGSNGGTRLPLPVEQMPLITAFRRGSMIKLVSGEMKAVEDLREEDFEKAAQMMQDTMRIVYCHVISIQGNGQDSSMCKVTLAMGSANNQQVVVDSSPEQPFFVRGRGWSSFSPKQSEKLLQLPCSTLAVGDICITLTRHVKPVPAGGQGRKKSGPRPYGTYAKSRNSSTTSILKSTQKANNGRVNGRKASVPQQIQQQQQQEQQQPIPQPPQNRSQDLVQSQIVVEATQIKSNIQEKEAVIPTVSSEVTSNSTTAAVSFSETPKVTISPSTPKNDEVVDLAAQDLDPPSPKKRRWSAPEQIEVESQSGEKGAGETSPIQTTVNTTNPTNLSAAGDFAPGEKEESKSEMGSGPERKEKDNSEEECKSPKEKEKAPPEKP